MPRLFIKAVVDFNNCTLAMNVEPTDTIGDIKERALDLINGDPLRRHHGTVLFNEQLERVQEGWPGHTLAHYNIRDGDTLSMSNLHGHSF